MKLSVSLKSQFGMQEDNWSGEKSRYLQNTFSVTMTKAVSCEQWAANGQKPRTGTEDMKWTIIWIISWAQSRSSVLDRQRYPIDRHAHFCRKCFKFLTRTTTSNGRLLFLQVSEHFLFLDNISETNFPLHSTPYQCRIVIMMLIVMLNSSSSSRSKKSK